MIKVVICDDHAMVRRGIRDTLADAVDIEVTGEAGSYSEVRELLRKVECQVLILDLNMPGRGGLEVLASIKDSHPEIRTLIVTMFSEDQYAIRCLRSGAHGYLNKAEDPAKLTMAVRTLAQGRRFVTQLVSDMLVDNLANPRSVDRHSTLSEREMQTLIKIASGRKLSQIAEEMMLSPKTVSVYRSRLLEKLQLNNNAELAIYAIRNELV